MRIEKELHKAIVKKAEQIGVTVLARKSDVNYRSAKKAVELGEGSDKVCAKLTKFLVRDAKKRVQDMSLIKNNC